MTQFFGGAVGLDIGRHLGVEMVAEGFEARLDISGLGNTSELGVGYFIPHARFRYPIAGGRLVPYVLGGVGLSTVKTNDTKSPGKTVDVDVDGYGIGAALGAGVEYFVANNIAAGLEARYLTARGHTAGRRWSGARRPLRRRRRHLHAARVPGDVRTVKVTAGGPPVRSQRRGQARRSP